MSRGMKKNNATTRKMKEIILSICGVDIRLALDNTIKVK